MPTDAANKSFQGNQEPIVLDAQGYANLLEKLVVHGQGYGKTEPVTAFKLHNIRLVTETESGLDEVDKEVNVEQLYIVMDQTEYPNDYVQKLVITDIMSKYARKVIGESELNEPEFKGPGLWTSKTSSFEFDYNKSEEVDNQFDPDPEATRICLTLDQPVIIPTQWGQPFTIEAGGTLAIRENDFAELVERLTDIRAGKISVTEALLKSDSESILDVYGMNPGFLEANYGDVSPKPETVLGKDTLSNIISGRQDMKYEQK